MTLLRRWWREYRDLRSIRRYRHARARFREAFMANSDDCPICTGGDGMPCNSHFE